MSSPIILSLAKYKGHVTMCPNWIRKSRRIGLRFSMTFLGK